MNELYLVVIENIFVPVEHHVCGDRVFGCMIWMSAVVFSITCSLQSFLIKNERQVDRKRATSLSVQDG